MEFIDYARAFREQARTHRKNEQYIARCLQYAQRLHSAGAAIIYDLDHLALLVGYDVTYLTGAAHATELYYRRFHVRKKSGGLRTIHEPLPSLKEIQRWILDNVLAPVRVSPFAKGFVEGRSIKDNARFHRRQRHVLTVDIRNFFPSISRTRTYVVFRSIGYSKAVATILARLCCRNDELPQGAPTSPAISNLVALTMDKRLSAYARRNAMRYTRYADDLTFSGELNPGRVIGLVRAVAKSEGFQLNDEKTRLMGRHEQQEVTGIVVNERMHAPRATIRELRKQIHFIRRFGVAEHMQRTGVTNANFIRHLMGLANFVLFVDPANRDGREAMTLLREVQART